MKRLLESRHLAISIVVCLVASSLASTTAVGAGSGQESTRMQGSAIRGATAAGSQSDLRAIAERVARYLDSSSSNGKTSHGVHAAGSATGIRGIARMMDPSRVQTTGAARATRANWEIRVNENNRTPVFITGEGLAQASPRLAASASGADIALAFIQANADLFRLDDSQSELRVISESRDHLGKAHVEFEQRYKGIPVWAQNIVVHLEGDGRLYAVNARYAPTPNQIDLSKLRISQEEAIRIAEANLSPASAMQSMDSLTRSLLHYQGPKATLYVWIDRDTQVPHLVWHVETRPNIQDWMYSFVDAHSREIRQEYNNTQFDGPAVGSGTDLQGTLRSINVYQVTGTYYMMDATRSIWQATQPDVIWDPRGALWTTDLHETNPKAPDLKQIISAGNTWTDPTAVSAHYNVGVVFEYFRSTHGRQAIDGSGGTILSAIHCRDTSGAELDNAFWGGTMMVYGDGNIAFDPLGKALDVAAHEMGHGVTQNTVDLEYLFQSGALNESISDVWGCMVDRDDWNLAEDIARPSYFPTGIMRNMADPHNGGAGLSDHGWQPAHMSEYQLLSEQQDHGGVHVNSGIPNHAAYLVGTAIGKDKLERIWYRILSAKLLNKQSNFCDMRSAAVQSATDLYGPSSSEVNAVKSAFDQVGIIEGCGGQLPPTDPPMITGGTEWIAVVNADGLDESLWIVSPEGSPLTAIQLTPIQINTASGKPFEVTTDGSAILFIAADYNIYGIEPSGGQATQLTFDGLWWSLAISPDGSKIAVTKAAIDSAIHVLDLLTPANSMSVQLYSPTTQDGVNQYTTLYADVIEWDPNGQFLIYDAFNQIARDGTDSLLYWEVNIMDAGSAVITRLFPPQPEGVNIGNPSFAAKSASVFAFDYFDENLCAGKVMAGNLFTGELADLVLNGCNFGFPHYAPDGSELVFQSEGPDALPALYRMPVDPSSLMQPTGPVTGYLLDAQLPYWFVTGGITAVGDEEEDAVPSSFSLEQNYPNPFNSSTVISYSLRMDADVRVDVFDILGRKLVTLMDAMQPQGAHHLNWDGRDAGGRVVPSGVYFYQLRVANSVETKKMVLLK